MENSTPKSSDLLDRPATSLLSAAPLGYPTNVALCYQPQPSPLADGNQASGSYLVPPSMASPSSCLATQQMYSNYPPSPYYRGMLGSQQSYYGTILPTPGHHSSAFYGTFYNSSSSSVYSGQAQASLNHPMNYYSPSLYMPQNHDSMWNSSSQPPSTKRPYIPYDASSSSLDMLPSCSKMTTGNLSASAPVPEPSDRGADPNSSLQIEVPSETTAAVIEPDKSSFPYGNLTGQVSEAETCMASDEEEDEVEEEGEEEEEEEDQDQEQEDEHQEEQDHETGQDHEQVQEEQEGEANEVEEEQEGHQEDEQDEQAQEPPVATEFTEDMGADEDLEDEEESCSSSTVSTCSSEYSEDSSCLSEELLPFSPILEQERRFLEVVPSRVFEEPNDTSFGEGDIQPPHIKDWVNADEGLQCLLCTSDDHLLPRLDIAIKLEPVVGEHISKSVLLCTACDLMMERYLSLEKEVAELQVQIQLMYQSNKELEAARGAQLSALSLPNLEAQPQPETLLLDSEPSEPNVPNSESCRSAPEEISPPAVDQPTVPNADQIISQALLADVPEGEHPIEPPADQMVDGKEPGEANCVTSHQCEQCGKNFVDRSRLKQHIKTHGKWEYRCDVCTQILSTKSSWRNHMRLHRTDQLFQCEHCPRTFPRRAQYLYHVKVHHGTSNFQCSVCHKNFSSRGSLKTHSRIHSGEKPFICETCGRGFNVSSNLLAHIPICTKQLPFKCSDCGKSFGSRSAFHAHTKIHRGDSSLKCEECGAVFVKQSHLTAHLRVHTKEKPYQCPTCGKSFASLGNCNSHQKTHQADQRPFVCEVCGKRFSRRHGLEIHLNRHTGLKPYQCLECPKAFHDASNLINHSKTHKNKPS